MNPETNKFEFLQTAEEKLRNNESLNRNMRRALAKSTGKLYRPNGTKVPKHWTILSVGELVVIKDYTFKVAHIGESHLLLEPVPTTVLDTKP